MIRNSFPYASKADWAELANDLRPVYSAPTEQAAAAALDELAGTWGERYPAIIRLSENAGPSSCPSSPTEPRSAKSSTRRTRSRACTPVSAAPSEPEAHFPNEQAALKCLYLTIRSLDPTGRGGAR